MTQEVLTATGLTKSYGTTRAVDGVDLALRRGEITCLLGPSGCGKTSLIRLLAGLERPEGGTLVAAGRQLDGPGLFVPPEQRLIGLVFQDIALFPHLTAAENVAFGLSALPRAERRSRALALLEQFRLGHRADAYPHTLSGGEQQRVGIARALAPEPAALLLDEPFSGLDGELRAAVRTEVAASLRRSGAGILIVTHDPEEAMLLGERLALMHGGRIVQAGSPEQCYARPASVEAACLLGRINILPASVSNGVADTVIGQVPAGGLADGPAKLLIRPEQLVIMEGGAEAEVTQVRFGGSFREVEVMLTGTPLLLRVPLDAPVPQGSVSLRLCGMPSVVPA
jgi:iron(III) transport system ATP-binding protein